jgi:hypothetical protein
MITEISRLFPRSFLDSFEDFLQKDSEGRAIYVTGMNYVNIGS